MENDSADTAKPSSTVKRAHNSDSESDAAGPVKRVRNSDSESDAAGLENVQKTPEIDKFRAWGVLTSVLADANIKFCSDDLKTLDFDELLGIIRKGDTFRPVVDYFLNNTTRIPDSFQVNPGYVNLSFIRHGESIANARRGAVIPDYEDVLTEQGQRQAHQLGKKWANVRIDAQYTSPYPRARETARLLAEHNHSHPEAVELDRLKEHDWGPVVRDLLERSRWDEAFYQRTGMRRGYFRSGSPAYRTYIPPDGESIQDLVHRGIAALRQIAIRHAVALPVPPKEMEPGYTPLGTADELVKDVPHVVVVSHNIFLAELWEALGSWNKEEHCTTNVDYRNAGWSRHILKFQGYGSNRPEKGYYAVDFPFEMQIKDLNPPII